jgi:pyruvate/oxaloacetate carboxyltransferase
MSGLSHEALLAAINAGHDRLEKTMNENSVQTGQQIEAIHTRINRQSEILSGLRNMAEANKKNLEPIKQVYQNASGAKKVAFWFLSLLATGAAGLAGFEYLADKFRGGG